MGNGFEFDKVVWAIAVAIFTLVLSINLGGFLYRVERIPAKNGFIIEVTATGGEESSASKELPTTIEIGKIMATANAEAGQQVFTKCMVCHTGGKGEMNKVGPNLWGIVGAKIARSTEFKYSEAMIKHGTESSSWTYEELYRYLYAPKKRVPGTKMAFAGIKKDDERANLIAYLRTLADNPLPIPASEK